MFGRAAITLGIGLHSSSTGDCNVFSDEGTLAPPGEYDELVHPLAHSSPQPKW